MSASVWSAHPLPRAFATSVNERAPEHWSAAGAALPRERGDTAGEAVAMLQRSFWGANKKIV